MIVARPEVRTRRGVEGAPEVVIEILSPEDETYEKLPFYERMRTREVWIIDPETRKPELYVLRRERLRRVSTPPLRSAVLGITLSTKRTRRGPRLLVSWSGGVAVI